MRPRTRNCKQVLTRCYESTEDVKTTVQNASLSPAQISQMTSAGIAVSQGNASSFFDGTPSGGSLSADLRRNVDPAELWENAKVSCSNLRKEAKRQKTIYGD